MPVILQFRPSVGSYRFSTSLQNDEFLFDVRWNSRDAAWYVDVRAIDETPIAVGIKVVLGAYLGRRANHPLFQQGVFVARPANSDRREPTFDDLGTRVQIWYFTRDEMVQEIVGGLMGFGAQ